MTLIITDQYGNPFALSVNATDGSLQTVPAPGNTPTPGGTNSITSKALDIISAAMTEIGALAQGQELQTNDAAWLLQKFQRLIDRYNARRPLVYTTTFSVFTIPVNTMPVTIGPGGNFDVIQRPTDIPSIGLILVNTTPTQVESPILNRRDRDWWTYNRVKNLTSNLPTDYYYEPDWPLGSIYLWPVPTDANQLRIQQRLVLTEITTFNQQITLPPAYWDLLVYELAISIAPSFEREPSATLVQLWKAALKAVEGNNIQSPRGRTCDAGMPGIPQHGTFNYYDALPK